MSRHDCPGDGCRHCQRLIDQAEAERDSPREMDEWDQRRIDDRLAEVWGPQA